MPTATSTLTRTAYSPQITFKSGIKPLPTPLPLPSAPASPSSNSNAGASTSAALRSLYTRAARAFLLREIPLAHSLLESAFQLLKPPVLVHDALPEHRRKWDIFRITLETTIYSDPPAMELIPEPLRANLTESPQTLMTSIYARSLALFTPTNGASQKSVPNTAYLPSAVLITLLHSSLKIGCPDIGRMMAEQWISRREPPLLLDSSAVSEGAEEEGYDKVIEIYCLDILPKLEQWSYAKEFLQFEGELREPRRELLKSLLNAMHAEVLAARRPQSLPSPNPQSSSSSSRSHSPTPSSSSSSSLSTTSTHTIVPATPRGNRLSPVPQKLTSLDNPSSSSSTSSERTATPHGRNISLPNGRGRSRSKVRTTNSSASSAASSTPRTAVQTSSVTPTASNTYALIKASLAPYLTTSKVTTFLILFVLFPLVSWILRIRHKRRKLLAAGGSATPLAATTNVDLVRRRLQAAGGSDAGIISRLWREGVRAVVDTVKMAGSGLV